MRGSRFLLGKWDVRELLFGKGDAKEFLITGGTVFVTMLFGDLLAVGIIGSELSFKNVLTFFAIVVPINGTLLTLSMWAVERHRSRLAKGMGDDAGAVTPH